MGGGTGLGLLCCVTMDDASMKNYDKMDNNNNEEMMGFADEEKARHQRKNKQEEWIFIKRAGEIMFEYFYQPTPTNVNNDVELSTNDSNAVNGCLISLCH